MIASVYAFTTTSGTASMATKKRTTTTPRKPAAAGLDDRQAPPRKPVPIDVGLAKAIRASGLTHYHIGTRAGVPSTTIDRFLYRDERHRGLTLATATKIAAVLGLELRPVT